MIARQASGVRRAVTIGSWVVALLALGFGWRYLAPPQLGGATSYVTTTGGSMEPLLGAGDLVLVRASDSYEVGDVVAYRSRTLDAVVLHRIVGVDGDRFITQGDANTWTDSERPTQDQIIGSMALRAPGLGRRIGWLRSPSGVAVIAGCATLILGLGLLRGRSRRRSRHLESELALHQPFGTEGSSSNGNGHAASNGNGHAASNGNGHAASNGSRKAPSGRGSTAPARGTSVAISLLATAALVSVGLAAVAFARPDMANADHTITYQQEGVYSYSAPVTGGQAVYGPDGLSTGDPVYLRLADRLDVTFDYSIDTTADVTGSGTIGLWATISDADGWRREFELTPPTPFQGGRARVLGSLDLGRLADLVREIQHATGVERDAYAVSVQARVEGTGAVAGREIGLTFAPALPFSLSELELQLSPGDQDIEALLEPVSGGLVTGSRLEPNDLSLFGVDVAPRTLRVLAIGVAVAAIVALCVLLVVTRRLGRRSEHEQIAARYGRLLLSVDASGDDALVRTIEAESMETLVQLAAHHDQPVLHGESDGQHTYFFREGGVTYRYRAEPSPASAGAAGGG